tara:strand:- start:1046 stop:1951 length:906 start_codon:yes stop_codon:yes gene_type:complete
MLTFPVNTIFVEGPDCSGKTTLIKSMHELTNYSLHLMDRSHLSRMIFASFYGRKISNCNYDFHSEVSNLNNRYYILLPNIDIVRSRFEKRGDELHDIKSLESVYKAFQKTAESLRGYPNITVVNSNKSSKAIAKSVIASIFLTERPQLREISDQVSMLVKMKDNECYPLQFTLCDDGKFEEASADAMLYKPEKEYYENIYNLLHEKISRELEGKNEYNRAESPDSRRFVYTDDSCISFIQVAVRDNVLDFHVVIRSTNVKDTFPHDLKFLYYLASTCYKRFDGHCKTARLRFNLNSAHIII